MESSLKSNYYLESLIKLKCASDWLRLNIFPNVKEVTESLGAFEAVAQNFKYEFSDPNINIVVVADGGTPRTATVFATRTRWNCYSIDPEMSNKDWESKIKGLKVFRTKIEDVKLKFDSPTVLVAPHSHVSLDTALKSINCPKNLLGVVAIPCCHPQYIKGLPHHIEYNDHFMHTPKNLVKIWRNLQGS